MSPSRPVKIVPGIQHYVWGGTEYIAQWLGMDTPSNRPIAEAWFGDHHLAPAQLIEGPLSTLDSWIASNPSDILGPESVSLYGDKMPFLLKILDVREMLSLQLHPTKSGALEGYQSEDQRLVHLNAPNRNYKDKNHKPELLFALSDFWLLQGFESLPLIRQRFAVLLPDFLLPFDFTWRSLMDLLWIMEGNEYMAHLATISKNLLHQNLSDKNDIYHWIHKALTTYPYQKGSADRGILIMMMLHVQYLKPGEVGYQAAGVLHAYLEGQNVELMANSDNVLRGGLTPKHIDPVELMRHLNTETRGQCILEPIHQMDDEVSYTPPVKDFVLKHFTVKNQSSKTIQSETAAVLLVRSGELSYDEKILRKGESVVIPAYATLEVKCTTDSAEYFLACASL